MALRLPRWSAEQAAQFDTDIASWESRLKAQYLAHSGDEAAEFIANNGLNYQQMLQALPYQVRDRFMRRYRSIIGFDDLLGDFSGEVPDTLREVSSGRVTGRQRGGARRVFRFNLDMADPTTAGHPLAPILSGMSVQYDQTMAEAIAAGTAQGAKTAPFGFGSRILRSDYAKSLNSMVSGQMTFAPGANVLVFDTETTGLSYTAAGVREVSAVNMRMGREGWEAPTDAFHQYFRTAKAQVGMLSDRGVKSSTIADFLNGVAPANIEAGIGDEFAGQMKTFLRQMQGADYIAGHNVQFDLDQILQGLTRTAAYHADEELRGLVTSVSDSLRGSGKVLDTLQLASARLPGLDLAPELSFGGQYRPYSLENIMLQSNMIERMVGESSEEEVLRFLGLSGSGAMHQADVDTRVTAKLLGYLTDDVGLTARQLGADSDFGKRVRSMVLRSYAPTPISNIADIRHLDPRLFEQLLQEGDDRIRFLDPGGASSFERMRLQALGEGRYRLRGRQGVQFEGTGRELYEKMAQDVQPFFASMEVTPLEQEVFLTRNLLERSASRDSGDVLFSLGHWRRWTGQQTTGEGFLNRLGTIFKQGSRPSEAEFSQLQDAMRKAGIPFAGLSLPERMLTNAMAQASAGMPGLADAMGGTYAAVAGLADDLGISHFRGWDSARLTRGGRVTIPMDVLKHAEAQGVINTNLNGGHQGFSLSPFEDRRGGKFVNLSLDLDEAQSNSLARFLRDLDPLDTLEDGRRFLDMGFTPEKLTEIADAITAHGPEWGIAVGRLDGAAGAQAHAVLTDILQEQAMRDTGKIPFRTSMIDEAGGFIRTGPVVLDRFMDEAARTAHEADLSVAANMIRDITSTVSGNARGEGMMDAASFAAKTGKSDLARNIFETYGKVRKASPFVLAAAALAGGAYYMGKRHHENEKYDATFERQPIESQSDYSAYRRQMGMSSAPARRTPDPLLTANVVSELDSNRIGHTQMGFQRYAPLFGGNL